jgi:glycine cleavage system aminomethyltransferase T
LAPAAYRSRAMEAALFVASPGSARLHRLAPPGAKVVDRDGRLVTAHYGSVATELAVCRKAVGMSVRTELRILEVCGREPWLERLLSRALGGRVPEVGTAAIAAGAWCCRTEQDRALVIGPSGAVERWRRVAREAVIGGSPISAAELTDAWAPLSLIGPKAPRLLALAGADAQDLPVGGLAATTVEGAPALVLRAGADHWLALLDADAAPDACRALFEAGRGVGLSLVGCEAVARLAAAARPMALA